MDDAQLIDSPRELPALTFVPFADRPKHRETFRDASAAICGGSRSRSPTAGSPR